MLTSPLPLSCSRSFDMYGFSHSHHDTLQGDEDLLRIKVRKNELQAHRVLDVSHYALSLIPLYMLDDVASVLCVLAGHGCSAPAAVGGAVVAVCGGQTPPEICEPPLTTYTVDNADRAVGSL